MDGSSRPIVAAGASETPLTSCRGFYQCGVCKKEYARADHLTRHVRSHTADKPFTCERCGKGFTRIDILRRHTQGHRSTYDHHRSEISPGIRSRVSQACKSCATSKLKCDDEKPCRRCVRRGQICQWSQIDDSLDNVQAHDPEVWPGDPPGQEQHAPMEQGPSPMRQLSEGLLGHVGPEPPSEEASITSLQYDSLNQEVVGLDTFPLTGFDRWNICGGMNFDFELTDEDLEFLDSMNRAGQPRKVPEQATERYVPTIKEHPNQVGTESIHDSPLSHWTPRAEDNAYMDQHYLSVPKHLDTPSSTGISRPRISQEPLSRESRDAAFAVVVTNCQQTSLNRIMQCFPSAELLDSLIYDFLTQQRSQIDTWIHVPTLQLNQESPEMILTLAAAGAVLSNVEAIQRLGYAILEIARLQVNSKFEDNNTLTRHFKQQQEYVLLLQIGLWSGDKRRVEIAESFTQPVVTMLRRASRFKHETYPIITPDTTDSDATLNRKWHEWVEQESFKRLVHHIFMHDVQASVLRSTNPLMSHLELDLPIPMSRKLWDAKSATQWKSIYLQEVPKTSLPIPSLATCLQDVSSLGRFPSHGDGELTALASIHGISTMIADCHHTGRGPSGQWREMVMKLWQQELQQVLEQFEIFAIEPLQRAMPALPLIYQAISLSLYMPLGVLETFSGKDGEKRSSDMYQSFIQHIRPSNLRQASWHAGQVLRIARSLPPGSLTAFCATCFYFAGVALWTLSTVFSLKGLASGAETDNNEAVFLLDGEPDSAALRRFTISGQGTPAISSSGQHVLVRDRAAVMHVFRQLLWSKHRGGTCDQQTRALNHAFIALGSDYSLANGGQRKRKTPGS